MRNRARIATLAVVQTVYPTIKSDARLCWGNPLASARFERERILNTWADEHRGKEQAESSTTRAHLRSFPLSRSLHLPPSHSCVAFLSCFSLYQTHPLSTPPIDDSLRSYFPLPFPSLKRLFSRVVEGRNVFVFGLSPDNLRQ